MPRPTSAIRWWKKRSVTILSWLRLLMVRPSRAASSWSGVSVSEVNSAGVSVPDPRTSVPGAPPMTSP